MLEAARASLRLIDADPSAARRRVVVALDAPDADVEIRDDLDRGVVRLGAPVPFGRGRVRPSGRGEAPSRPWRPPPRRSSKPTSASTQAQDTVDDAEGFELSWYATQELDRLLDALG